MSQRIDAELEKLTQNGQTPKAIHVGSELYNELDSELNPIFIAPLVSSGEQAPVYKSEDVSHYKEIPVFHEMDEPKDYLKIIS